ncbi:MAG: hypothetical protein H8E44_31635 [Planctomycetes bacterium]|nr:hypothetical protein [Planctomycetota bacterium]
MKTPMIAFTVVSVMIAFGSTRGEEAAAEGASAQENSVRDWTVADFEQRGHVSRGLAGEQHEQLRFWDWQDNTLLDLRESQFLALEGGPFHNDSLPRQYPSGAELDALTELASGEKYPVSIKGRGSRNIAVLGGRIVGQQPRQLPWRIMKKFYDGDGVRVEASGDLIVDGTYIENTEDGFSPRGDGRWILRSSHMRYIRDDFVENDGLLSGEIIDCLADGVYVFLSARPGKNADPQQLDKRQPPVVKIRDTLVHLQPMPYDGDMKLGKRRFIKEGKTCGMLFKWSRWAGTVDVTDCIFRVDGMAASGPKPMRFPEGVYRNVTLVWLGGGDYPADLPNGVTMSRDVEVWNRARTTWLSRHQ